MEADCLDSAEGFERDCRFVGQAVVVDVFAYAACSVATHACFRSVGIENAHPEVGNHGGAYNNDAVGSDAGVWAAHLDGKLFDLTGSRCEAIDVDVIIAQTMHLCKEYLLHSVRISFFDVAKIVNKNEKPDFLSPIFHYEVQIVSFSGRV